MNSTLPFDELLPPSHHRPSGWSNRPPRVGEAIQVRVPTRRVEKAIEAPDRKSVV